MAVRPWNLHRQETLRVDGAATGKVKIKTQVGNTQGSTWSPAEGTVYTTELQDGLNSIGVDAKAPKIGPVPVPEQMYADDLILNSLSWKGMQKLFDCAEQHSKKDGTSISYSKCEAVCFRFKKQCGPKSLTKLIGLDSVIPEKTEEVTK